LGTGKKGGEPRVRNIVWVERRPGFPEVLGGKEKESPMGGYIKKENGAGRQVL